MNKIETTPRFELNAAFRPQLTPTIKLGPCLLISREIGAGGSEIAQLAARQLGWQLFDKEIINVLAARHGTSRELLRVVDETRVGWLADIFYGWIEGHGFSQLAYVHRLHTLFSTLASEGGAVIVGRGARFVLPRAAAFSVRIVAPLEYRVQRVSQARGLSRKNARKLVEHTDGDRTAFIQKFFHRDVTDSHLHDLVINTEHLNQESVLNLIMEGVKAWTRRRRESFQSPRT
jgi:shikimate kinase